MSLLRVIASSCLLALGCGITSSTIIGAAVNTTIGAGAAVHSRNEGGCFSVCTADATCNHATGMCERVPCGGECPAGQECQDGPRGPQCMAQVPIPAQE